jgi:hypothetical protein
MIQINCQIIKFQFSENGIWDRKKVLSYFISQRAKHLLQRSPLKQGIPRQECKEYNPLDVQHNFVGILTPPLINITVLPYSSRKFYN